MFNRFSKIKNTFVEKRISIVEKKETMAIENEEKKDANIFLSNLNTLMDLIYPYINPSDRFDGFREYSGLNQVEFKTKENKYSQLELIQLTGLNSITYVGGWDCDKWKCSHKEYVRLYESNTAENARAIKSALNVICTKIKTCENEYSNFIIKYSDTLSNVNAIINQYGMNFVIEDSEIFNKIKSLVLSFIEDYESYTEAIRTFKKAQILEKLNLEQEYVDKMVNDSTLLLDLFEG